VSALAGLAQTLVAHISAQLDAGELGRPPREWSVRENRWLAARYGIDAELIVDDHGRRVPARDLLEQLVRELEPTAERLGSADELADTLRLWSIGPSYLRQRRITDAGGSLEDVVASLARQLEAGEPS